MCQPSQSSSSDPCPVCTQRRLRIAFRAIGHIYEQCLGCGFQRMQDPMARTDLDAYYAEEREHGEQAWQEHEQNVAKFDRMIARLERRVPPGRFLDVGCSLGSALVAARERGWNAVGIELSRPVAEFGRKEWDLDIRTEHLEEIGFPAGSFDVVWMHHTLEHVPDPAGIIAECRRLLTPGGLMYQVLPNHGSLKGRVFGSGWSYGVTWEHLSLFTARTLRLLLQRLGFRVAEQQTPSHRADPRFLYNLMHKLGRLDQLMRWCGKDDGEFDTNAYIGFLSNNRLARWISERAWPASLVSRLGLGEEVAMIAVPDGASSG